FSCWDARWGPDSGSDACRNRASSLPDKRLLRDIVHIGIAGGDAAPGQRDPPVALFSVYLDQIVLSGRLGASRRLSRRSHAHDRYRAVLTVDAICRRQMGMAVQHEFGAALAHELLETADAEQPLMGCRRTAHRGMVDQDDAAQATPVGFVEQRFEAVGLAVAEEAAGHEGRR